MLPALVWVSRPIARIGCCEPPQPTIPAIGQRAIREGRPVHLCRFAAIGCCASPQPIVRGRSHCTFGRTPTPFWRKLSGFPATRIDGELYWDGGILSNTPTEAVFDDDPRKDS